MTLFEKHLTEYMLYEEQRLEDDVVQLNNHTHFRTADPVDHLEMIMVQTRLATEERIFRNIYKLLAINHRT